MIGLTGCIFTKTGFGLFMSQRDTPSARDVSKSKSNFGKRGSPDTQLKEKRKERLLKSHPRLEKGELQEMPVSG